MIAITSINIDANACCASIAIKVGNSNVDRVKRVTLMMASEILASASAAGIKFDVSKNACGVFWKVKEGEIAPPSLPVPIVNVASDGFALVQAAIKSARLMKSYAGDVNASEDDINELYARGIELEKLSATFADKYSIKTDI